MSWLRVMHYEKVNTHSMHNEEVNTRSTHINGDAQRTRRRSSPEAVSMYRHDVAQAAVHQAKARPGYLHRRSTSRGLGPIRLPRRGCEGSYFFAAGTFELVAVARLIRGINARGARARRVCWRSQLTTLR